MFEHDPQSVVVGLSAKLAARSRHVCLFLGAGVAKACGLPDVTDLQAKVLAGLAAADRTAFEALLAHGNFETGLTRLRRIAALLVGKQELEGLTAKAAIDLDANVCKAIVKELDVSKADLTAMRSLGAWAARADYLLPLEIFTVNYDLLIESSLEELRVPYFDGFSGTLRAGFHAELVEAAPNSSHWVPSFFVRVWKLHGSVNWAWTERKQIVRLGQATSDGDAAAIYPSDTKYEESRRVPFIVLQDRFRRALHQPETLVIISGYSFGDSHLNELLFDAATQRERSEIIAFCHGDIPAAAAERALITPNLQLVGSSEAIISGIRAKWRAPKDSTPGVWIDSKFALTDFRTLASHLARSAARETLGGTAGTGTS
jgi:hypothetical protein